MNPLKVSRNCDGKKIYIKIFHIFLLFLTYLLLFLFTTYSKKINIKFINKNNAESLNKSNGDPINEIKSKNNLSYIKIAIYLWLI